MTVALGERTAAAVPRSPRLDVRLPDEPSPRNGPRDFVFQALATCALALGAGATLEEATVLSNHAAGVAVGKVGTAAVSAAELRGAVRAAADRRGTDA
jgi:hypothetical protein